MFAPLLCTFAMFFAMVNKWQTTFDVLFYVIIGLWAIVVALTLTAASYLDVLDAREQSE